jgi:glucose-1-phosphate cytidylyltransferase
MKAVILAGGFGTRISEETHLKPKPMVEIGGKPILWHIMKTYSKFGITDFVICLGYKGYLIKEYFANYHTHMSDITIDLKNNKIELHRSFAEPWKITLVDTGIDTLTGGRLKKVEKFVDDRFCLTYGDGLSDVNITKLLDFHKKNRFTATLTAVQPPGRFGLLSIKNNNVLKFQEKPKGDSNWINGGYFVFESEIFDYIKNSQTILEREPLEILSKKRKLGAFKHDGFWQPMDTLRDKNYLEELWIKKNAPWKIW